MDRSVDPRQRLAEWAIVLAVLAGVALVFAAALALWAVHTYGALVSVVRDRM